MKQPPSESLRDNLVGPCKAFADNPDDVGLARAAALAVNNHAEWTYKYYVSMGKAHRLLGAKSLDEFRERVAVQCPELKTLWHAADGARHRDLDNRKHALYAASTAQFMPGDGPIRWTDGRPFLEIVRVGVDYWSKWTD